MTMCWIQRNNQTGIRESAGGTIQRLSPVGPMPHKDLITPPSSPLLAGLAEWTDSGLSISLPLLSSGDSPLVLARAVQFKGCCCFGEPLWESH